MKKKSLIIVIICLIIIAGLVTTILLLNGKKSESKKEEEKEIEKVVVTFETEGGSEVEKIEVEKGTEVELPGTSKDGYTFVGWYLGDDKKEDKIVVTENINLVARWEKIPEKVKTFTVSFDSKGGSKVSSITVECNKTLPTLPVPKRDAYQFVSWADKNGKVIGKGALLSCSNVTLYANWEYDGPVANPEQKDPTYKCPAGYYLEGTKCLTTSVPKEKCSGDRIYEYEGKCVKVNGTSRKDSQASCGKTTVHTGGGHTEEVQGEIFKMGTNYCFFKQVTDSYEQANSSNCTSRGHKWNSINNKCYYYRGEANEFVSNTCDHLTGYILISNPNQFSGVNGLNGGCFPITSKTQYCEDGYVLTAGSCIKTIDATVE